REIQVTNRGTQKQYVSSINNPVAQRRGHALLRNLTFSMSKLKDPEYRQNISSNLPRAGHRSFSM
ncbi:MAG: hypothetical protein C4576_19240, partial [Desulfobacteraceae bacterium]